MCAFHRTVSLQGRRGECAVAYFNTSWIIDRYEIEHVCQWQRLECTVDGTFVDDIESPIWKIERAFNASVHHPTASTVTIVTIECPDIQTIQNAQPVYYYHRPSVSSCEPEFQLDLPIHLRYGAHGIHHISPSPALSLILGTILCLVYLAIIITGENKKCCTQAQDADID